MWFNFAARPGALGELTQAGTSPTASSVRRPWGRRQGLAGGRNASRCAAMMAVDAEDPTRTSPPMTRPSRACKIFMSSFADSRQGLRNRGCCAWPRASGRMPRSSGRNPAGPHRRGARRLTAPPAASRPPATACARRADPEAHPSQRGKSGRPSGGQPGHKGNDAGADREPGNAAHRCRTPTVTARPSVDRSSIASQRPLEVTEHRAHRCLCGACATRSRLPGRRDRPGPVRATHHRLGELPAVRPSREALGRLRSSVHLHSPITAMGWRFEPSSPMSQT